MGESRMAVTGIGIASPAGTSLADFWHHLCEPGHKQTADISPCGVRQKVQARIVDAAAYNRQVTAYFLELCSGAILRAIEDSGIPYDKKKGCVIFGSGMGTADCVLEQGDITPDFPVRLIDALQRLLPVSVHVVYISNACCAGAQAIGYGCDLLRSGAYDYVVAGGVEIFSYLVYSGFQRLCTLDPQGCRPFDAKRKGIGVGDGAAFFTMQTGAIPHSYGVVAGWAATNDAYHVVSPAPDGEQSQRAIRDALKRAALQPRQIGAVIAHGTGTKANDDIEARSLHHLFGDIEVTAPKGAFGHTGGASGAFGMLTALLTLRYQMLPAVSNLTEVDHSMKIRPVRTTKKAALRNILVDCFAFGGTNMALICSKDGQAENIG